MTLRSFHVETRAGEPDTRHFTLNLTEFPDVPALTKIVPPPPVTALRPGTRSTGRDLITTSTGHRIYVLDPNNLSTDRRTLYDLAKHYYHDGSKWNLIVKASAPALNGVSPSDDLRKAIGERIPALKIRVPQNPDTGGR